MFSIERFVIFLTAVMSLTTATNVSADVVDNIDLVAPQIHRGNYLFAKVQDNGQSCVYRENYLLISVEAIPYIVFGIPRAGDPIVIPRAFGRAPRSADGVVGSATIGQSKGVTSLVTARSVATSDVIATLKSQHGNSSKCGEIVGLAKNTLAGYHGIYQGTLSFTKQQDQLPWPYSEGSCCSGKVCCLALKPSCMPCKERDLVKKLGTFVSIQRGTPFLEIIAKAAKETRSSGSVSCPEQPFDN